ncbi:hypothetical protein HNY73_014308 [Argiope bruennichi]|uniref:Uncharacterized protein n=1 Tax=Argiope bruennichi TaxID=94029 RepID=A0A8T0ESN9_ARGBR|nr:hypothetical protein HNY73_014308 [Argiope bruennichi]
MDSHPPLLQPHPIREGWMDVHIVKPDADDRDEQDGEHQNAGDPEGWRAQGHTKDTDIFAGDEVAVDEQSQGEKECHAAKNNDVVANCPV